MMKSIKDFQLKGIRYGVISEIIGCAAFVIIEQTRQVLKFGFDGKTDIIFVGLVFIFGNVLAVIPTIISSSILSRVLYRESLKHKLTLSKAIWYGCLIGVIAGAMVSLFGILITNARGSLLIYLWYSVEVTVIASVSGGWVGKRLARHFLT